MKAFRDARRAVLLTMCLLSACAAADPTRGAKGPPPSNSAGNFLAGRFSLAHGDFERAADELLGALEANPNDRELLIQTFIACVNAGRPEAVQLARRLPGNQVAHLLLANDAAKSGDWKEAIQRFRAVPGDGVMQLLQPVLVAWAAQGMGDTDQALAALRPSLSNPRFRSIVALHAGMIADLAGRSVEAAEFYQIAEPELGAQSPRSALILASWHARSGRTALASRLLTDMTAAVPEAAIALPGLLQAASRRPVARALEGMSEAYATFAAALRGPETGELSSIMSRLALDTRPDSATARLLASDAQSAARRYEVALSLLDEAVRSSDPLVPLIRLRRAALLHQLGRSEEAIREVERVSRDYPDSAIPDIQLGDYLRLKQRHAEAIAAYNRVIARIRQTKPDDWGVYYSRGIAYERSGQWSRAEADFSRALELSPDQPSVLNYLGYAWADMGRNLDKAQDMIQKAAARRPNDGAIADSLGWVAYRRGRLAEAVKHIERAVGLEPEDPTMCTGPSAAGSKPIINGAGR